MVVNHREVEALIRAMSKLWPTVPTQAKVDADMIRLWALVLADVPPDGAELVIVTRSRAGDRFPPTPGELVEHWHELNDRANGVQIPTADEAWREVRREIGRLGYMFGDGHVWSHPAIASAVEAMGWAQLCQGEEMINRAHFLKMYPTVAARARQEQVQERTFDALAAIGLTPLVPFGTIRTPVINAPAEQGDDNDGTLYPGSGEGKVEGARRDRRADRIG